jgi:hypothetical protein
LFEHESQVISTNGFLLLSELFYFQVSTYLHADTSKVNLSRAQSFQTYDKLNQKNEEAPQVALVLQNIEEILKCPTEVKV